MRKGRGEIGLRASPPIFKKKIVLSCGFFNDVAPTWMPSIVREGVIGCPVNTVNKCRAIECFLCICLDGQTNLSRLGDSRD